MYVSLDDTYSILQETTKIERLDSSKDSASVSNKFTTYPQGFLIQDSYNNPFLPVRPRPRIDTSKMDLIELYKRVRENYGRFSMDYLPWHFVCELVKDRYYVFNTRPVDLRFPLMSKQVEKKKELTENWDAVTQLFMKNKIFDISEAIHICVIGDSNIDIYTKKTYEKIGRSCIVPYLRYFRLTSGLFQRTFPLNLGKKFNINLLTKFVKR